jgi:hypothetical protein
MDIFPAAPSQLRLQYVFGRQPGTRTGSKSPNVAVRPTHDVYNRPFAGGYAMWVQALGKWPVSAVVKYDWYDPNTLVAGAGIGGNGTGDGDVALRSWGLGLVWRMRPDVRVQAYYEFNRNERAASSAVFGGDRPDDVFTLRVLYRF